MKRQVRKGRVLSRERVAAWLESRFYLRLHMFLILGGTYLAGLLITKLLLLAGVDRLWLRYSVAVIGAYLVFLALLRIWLYYVGADRTRGEIDISGDGVDLLGHFVPATDDPFGGGGGFGGAGSTGSWGEPIDAAPLRSASSSGGRAAPDGKGCGVDIGGDEGCVVVLVVALVLSLLVVGVYLIWTAPVLLSEAAFEAALAAALARRARKIQARGWVQAVWRATVWPFVAVLLLSAALGWYAQDYCPEAKKLRDVFSCANPR